MNPRALSFGDLLRQHRVAAGLSQEGLAERTGLSADAVGLLERGARRRPQRHTLDVLADALALEGEDRERFLVAARQPPPAIEPRMTDRLPRAPTPILGRERELETIATLLQSEVRLLTLTGPGGVGKTRLAIAAAERVCGTFADGVTFVSLAPIADPALLVSTIARALDVAEERGRPLQDTLEGALADRELLLVLDNFEHLAAAAPRVAELVAAAPRLRALVTSRARLRLRAEREVAVLPLPVPSAAARGDVAANPAVALYAARARAALVSFSLTPEVAHTVAAICRRLDGLPLAIELAAGRAKVLPPEALFARLEGGMAVLAAGPRDAPARHQSLAATLAWSHGLLQPAERALFRRLAVFRGGWTLESAEAVCSGDGLPAAAEAVCSGDGLPAAAVLDGLAALADQSLVVPPAEDGADPRFDMLETIREYAAEHLVESGETAAVRARHAANFLELATRTASGQSGSSARSELARLDAEHDNLRAALHWAEETRDARLGLGLAAALAEFWFFRAHYAEGRAWLERFLTTSDARASGEENARAGTTRARALEGLAALVYNQGDYGRAAALYEESIATYREASDSVGAARALTRLGGVARDAGDRGRAATLLEESLGLYRGLGDSNGIAHVLANLGAVVYFEGEFPRAEALLVESVARYRDLGDDTGLVFPLRFLAQVQAELGRFQLALQAAEESLALSREVGDRGGEGAALNLLGHLARDRGDLEKARALLSASLSDAPAVPIGIAATLESLAGVEADQGRPLKAARLLGAASNLRGTTADPPRSYMTHRVLADRAAVRRALGAEAFVAAWEAGRRLSLEAAVAEALRD